MGNYVWIYPTDGSKMYDYFFINQKPVNQVVYEFLYDSTYGFLKDLNQDVIIDAANKLNFKEIEAKKYYYDTTPQKSVLDSSNPELSLKIHDYLTEYVRNIIALLKENKNKVLKSSWKERIDK